ncbi:MAG: hypothetical protein JOZ69_25505 [Myxococcales bacterium]|nr:hypothetical protein [Myxococcales bacterium]
MTFATLRTLGLVGVGYAFVRRGGSGALGTTVGWVAAAVLIVPLALRSTGLGAPLPVGEPRPTSVPSSRAYLAVLGPIAGAQLCTNLLMQIDIALLGRFLSQPAGGVGSPEVGRDAVKALVAIYKECQTFAFLPYQLLFSVTLILFPMLARARAEQDQDAVRAYVARGARLAAIFCGLLVGVVVVLPESLLAFAYGAADAARGADVLRTMALAQGAFAMLSIATTVLTSLGSERSAALLTLGAVVAVAAACTMLVPGAEPGHLQLLRTAQASGAALAATLVVAGGIVRARTGAFVAASTALRTGAALGACLALGFLVPRLGRLVTPFAAIAVAGVYVGILIVTGELGRADLAAIRAIGGRRTRRAA